MTKIACRTRLARATFFERYAPPFFRRSNPSRGRTTWRWQTRYVGGLETTAEQFIERLTRQALTSVDIGQVFVARWTGFRRADVIDIRIPIEGAEWLRSSESA